MEIAKRCPLAPDRHCWKRGCAWWNLADEVCGVLSINRYLCGIAEGVNADEIVIEEVDEVNAKCELTDR